MDEQEIPRVTVSSNGFSVDDQMIDSVNHLYNHHRGSYNALLRRYPVLENLSWEGAWLDPEVHDPELSSWIIDSIENLGEVMWEEGEPFCFHKDCQD